MNITTLELPGPAVSPEWLAAHLDHPMLRVLDGSWYLPTSDRDARAEFLAHHIPGARFFDLDACSGDGDLPHMLPTPEAFADRARALGIGERTTVVVYDGSGSNLSAPRVWWMFRYFGHSRVAVLDGGSSGWTRRGLALEAGETPQGPPPVPAFVCRPRPELVRSAEQVLAALAEGQQVIDVRSKGRFEGTEPEPRPGLRGGHMPGSMNLPYTELTDGSGMAVTEAEARALIRQAGADPDRPIIATCGSGTSAGALAWTGARLGNDEVAIYDGSWAEWGMPGDLPVVAGPSGPDA